MSLDDEEVARIWERFRRGVREQVPDEDTTTHFDLAVAYLEMGMLDDAEAEFGVVLGVRPDHPAARAGLEVVRLKRGSSSRGPIGTA